MTGFTYSAGRLQNAAADWMEAKRRRSSERVQHADIYRKRMTFSDSARFDTAPQKRTEDIRLSPSGRFQVIEEARPKPKIISAEGIRWDAAVIALVATALICAAILLADLAGMGSGTRKLSRLESQISSISERNETMRAELAVSAGDVSICTEAVKLNLISGNAVQTVRLTAPPDVNMMISMVDQTGN